ncbi:MAG: hypothetical protein QXL94_06385 [Candidatus Parvarchaeum sp.]
MTMQLMVNFSVAASAAAGTRIVGSIYNLSQNPSQALTTINLTGHTITKAYVPAAAEAGNLAFFAVNPNGSVALLGTETSLTQTTVFNPNTIKNIMLQTAGDYGFAGVLTNTAGSSAVTVSLMVEIS